MASKKDFTQVNTGRVYSAIEQAIAEPQEVKNPRKAYSAEEAQKMQQAGTTQGRKGCKMVRINMAFTPEVHDFIKTMARVRGESVTQFTEYTFRKLMAEIPDVYERAKEFTKSLK